MHNHFKDPFTQILQGHANISTVQGNVETAILQEHVCGSIQLWKTIRPALETRRVTFL